MDEWMKQQVFHRQFLIEVNSSKNVLMYKNETEILLGFAFFNEKTNREDLDVRFQAKMKGIM